MSKFKCDFLPGGPKRKPKNGFAETKTPRYPACVFSGNPETHCLQMALTRNPKTASPKKKTPRFPAFFRGEMCTRAQFKFPFSSKGSKKKTQRRFREKQCQGFRSCLAAECVTGRNSNLHLFPRFFWPFFAVSFKLRRRYFEEGFGGEGASIYGARSANRTVQEGGAIFGRFSILRVKGLFRLAF